MKVTHAKKRCKRCGGELRLVEPESRPPHFFQFQCEHGGCGYRLQTVCAEVARAYLKAPGTG